MKRLFLDRSAIGVISVLVGILFGTVSCSQSSSSPASAGPANSSVVNFIATDEPGPWFKCVGNGCVPAGTESLAIVAPNTAVKITIGKETNTVHTFTSLLYPTGATNMPFDQKSAFTGSRTVRLVDPGLYVFVCKLHPFMLAATIVDDPATTDVGGLDGTVGGPAYDLGENITLINNLSALPIPTTSNLAARLLRAFFLITNPANYQDHNGATNPGNTWSVPLPGVVVQATGGAQLLLSDLSIVNQALPVLFPPGTPGIGEVWVDVEYEKTGSKTKPGTATVVDTTNWTVTRKVALPDINMNNPHNMWASRDQSTIYQTQWFDNKLTAFRRTDGVMLQNIVVGHSPAHVMTRVDTDQVHVSLNGEDAVMELNPGATGINRRILTQHPGENPAQPHAHWMSFDGKTMVTPNSNTADSTKIDIPTGTILAKTPTGTLPIATGMMPDASKYYVSNYLDSTITCVSIGANACNDGAVKVATKTINLLLGGTTLANYDHIDGSPDMSAAGALPIQTPVSPDGKYVVTANTLSGTITIIDTSTDTLVKVLPCSAGCHGLNFGAKSTGGYYAYVSSKFSNDLVVVDLNPTGSGLIADAAVVGRILLTSAPGTVIDDLAGVSAYAGMGGQGVLPVPNVYNGWVQKLPKSFCLQLKPQQRNPIGAPVSDDDCPL
jgi:DNA-binding beta-propeller fold protein YncE